jgi:DNA-binding MarR family transcriptional regulator
MVTRITLAIHDGEAVTIELPERTQFTIRSEEKSGKEDLPEKHISTKNEHKDRESKQYDPEGKTKAEQVAELCRQGKNKNEIAKIIGSTPGSVTTMITMLKKKGEIAKSRRTGETETTTLTKTQKELIRDMHNHTEYDDEEIAAELDLPISVVKKEIKNHKNHT